MLRDQFFFSTTNKFIHVFLEDGIKKNSTCCGWLHHNHMFFSCRAASQLYSTVLKDVLFQEMCMLWVMYGSSAQSIYFSPGAGRNLRIGEIEKQADVRPVKKQRVKRLGICLWLGISYLMKRRGVCSPFLNGATSVFRFLVWNDTLW